MSCGNSDILALIDYFQNGTDLSNNDWDNYNYYDLWNAIENGSTPPNRTVCGTFVQADIRSIVFAVLGVFTSPSDYLGENIDFYYLYLKAIGQEVVSPKFSNFCIGQLYNVFSIGLTAKFRQAQGFNVTMSKVAAIASITFEQGQQLDALLSKSAALQNAVFQQQQTFNAELAAGFTGLLDDYPNAAAAYSVRLLSSTYSGALVRIRKDTGGQPEKDFYPDENNELSLNSSDGGGTTLGSWIGGNDGYIVTWYNQSGNSGRDVTNSTASTQPKLLTAGVFETNDNGNIAVNYASGNYLRVTGVTGISTTNNEVYTVFENDSIRGVLFYSPSFIYYETGSASSALSGVGSPSLRVNGSDEGAITSRANLFTSVGSTTKLFGVRDIVPSAYSEIDILQFGAAVIPQIGFLSEYIVWDSSQSGNRDGIETNINDYFNIYV